jgi:hypothetical protein
MEENRKKLIQLRTKIQLYKNLDNNIQKVLDTELDIEDWSSEVYSELSSLENELDNLKVEMDLSDEEWDEDEN